MEPKRTRWIQRFLVLTAIAVLGAGLPAAQPRAAEINEPAVRIVAVDRQAGGAGAIATLAYVCGSWAEFTYVRVRIAQRLPDGAITGSTTQGPRDLSCTGTWQVAYVELHASPAALDLGSTLISARLSECDYRDCTSAYDQQVVSLGTRTVPAHRPAAGGLQLVLTEPATLAAGGAGVSVTARLRCDEPGEVYLDTRLTQRLSGSAIVGGRESVVVACSSSWRAVRVTVAAVDRAFRVGPALASVRVDSGPYVTASRTVDVASSPTTKMTGSASSGRSAVTRPSAPDHRAPLAGTSAGPAAVSSTERAVVDSASIEADGAGVIVRLRVTCEWPGWGAPELLLTVSQRLPDGSVVSGLVNTILNDCDGQPHATRVGVPASGDGTGGKPFQQGMALVQTSVNSASTETASVMVGPPRDPLGANVGDFTFFLKGSARSLAEGAGLQITATVRCSTGPRFAVLTVAQRQGPRVITGEETADLGCTSSEEWKTVRIAAFANTVAFQAGPAFVSLQLGYADDYQGYEVAGYAYRTVTVGA